VLIIGAGFLANRTQAKDRANITLLTDDEVRTAVLHARQDIKLLCFLLAGVIIMLGVIADSRTDIGYFSVLSELAIRIWGRFEQVGYRMKESTAAGVELRPDISVGIRFAEWLRKNHPATAAKHKEYAHWTPAGEFPARQYENGIWPLFVEFVDTVWLVEAAPQYFKTRDPQALTYLPLLLPAPKKKAS
jgi:hypothetical protein